MLLDVESHDAAPDSISLTRLAHTCPVRRDLGLPLWVLRILRRDTETGGREMEVDHGNCECWRAECAAGPVQLCLLNTHPPIRSRTQQPFALAVRTRTLTAESTCGSVLRSDNGLRLDEDEPPCPAVPGPSQRDPESSVRVVQLRPRSPALQHLHLLSQSEILHNEIRPRPKDRLESPDQGRREQDEQPEHGRGP